MNIQHREVVQWLHEIYGEEKIPPYEKTERSIDILHKLMIESKRAESQAKILTSDYTKKAAEYNAEALQLQKWQETIKFKPSDLSEESEKALTALSHTAQVLDVQIPTSTNIILAINQLQMEHIQVMNEQEQEKGRIASLLEMNKDLSKKLEKIREVYQQAEATWKLTQEDLANNTKCKQFSQEKCKNYSNDINKREAKLNQLGLTKEITHGNIAKGWSRLQALEREAKDLDKQLSSITLPADMTLAEVKVQEAQQELAAIMEELAVNCD